MNVFFLRNFLRVYGIEISNLRGLYFYILHTTVWIWLFTYFHSTFYILERGERREEGHCFFYVDAFNTYATIVTFNVGSLFS